MKPHMESSVDGLDALLTKDSGKTTKKNEHYLNQTDSYTDTSSTASMTLEDDDTWIEDEWEQYETFVPVPKAKSTDSKDLIPCSMLLSRTINDVPSMRLLRVLFDSGGTATMIHRRALPRGCVPSLLDKPITSTTVEGTFTTKTSVRLKGIQLPEFDQNKQIDDQGAFVFDGPCRYDIILGRDFLHKIGIQMDFANAQMSWMEHLVPMKDDVKWTASLYAEEDDFFATEIMEAK